MLLNVEIIVDSSRAHVLARGISWPEAQPVPLVLLRGSLNRIQHDHQVLDPSWSSRTVCLSLSRVDLHCPCCSVSLVTHVSTVTALTPSNLRRPTDTSSFYVGTSNGTITNSPNVPGKVFDRFIQIWLENTDFSQASSNSVFQNLTANGILLNSYYGVTHPSEPNYIASVGGDFFGLASDVLTYVPDNISTIVDLLDAKSISWSTYQENMPTDGYPGYNFTNPDNYTYYARKHNPLVIYDSVGQNATRAARIRNFNDFAVDVGVV